MMQRLVRLFRIERDGRTERWPIGFVFSLIARRRRGATADGGLDDAAKALAREIDDALQPTEARTERLRSDVKALRGEGTNSGVKGFSSGRVLGRS